MVTIYDIAKEAGVSISTVSNVIHGVKSHVSPDTVERIKKIIEEKQYKPNMSARALATKNSRIVGMLSHVEKQDYTCLPEDPFLGMLFSKKFSASERKESLPLSANAQKILFYLYLYL